RLLRRTHAPLATHTHSPQAFPAPDPRPPLAGLKLVRPRPRPDGRDRCGRSSLTPDHATAPNTAPARKASNTVPASPTATASHRANFPRPLDKESPHGWVIWLAHSVKTSARAC